MSTTTEIIAAIQAAADALYFEPDGTPNARAAVRVALGTPGDTVQIAGRPNRTGSAWVPEPTVFSTLILGLADWLDDAGTGQIATMRSKINELIGQYNQLLADHNSATVPSTASAVALLP